MFNNPFTALKCKGHCLEVNSKDGTLSLQSCFDFSYGCPDTHFWNYNFYNCKFSKTIHFKISDIYYGLVQLNVIICFQDSACQNINTQQQCFTAQPTCQQKSNNSDDDISPYYSCFAIIPFIILTIVLWIHWSKRRKRRQGICV